MKILGIINHNNRGGAQCALDKLCNQAKLEGKDFKLLYLYDKDTNNKMSNGTVLYNKSYGNIIKHIIIIYKLFFFIRNYSPDVVVCFLPYSNVLGSLVSFLLGIKVRIISHRNPVNTYNKYLRWVDFLFGCTRIYTNIICNSEAVRLSTESYPQLYKSKIKVVYNALPDERFSNYYFDNISNNKILINKYSGLINKNYIFSVGRLEEQKNYRLSLDIISNLDSDVNFLVAGNGSQKSYLYNKVKELGIDERTKFLGHLNETEIVFLMKNCLVYMQSSLYEGQSNALLEAINAGCCVVSSGVPSQREVLINSAGEEVGFIFSLDEDPKDIASSIDDLILNTTSINEYKRLAMSRSKDFTIKNMFDGFFNNL